MDEYIACPKCGNTNVELYNPSWNKMGILFKVAICPKCETKYGGATGKSPTKLIFYAFSTTVIGSLVTIIILGVIIKLIQVGPSFLTKIFQKNFN